MFQLCQLNETAQGTTSHNAVKGIVLTTPTHQTHVGVHIIACKFPYVAGTFIATVPIFNVKTGVLSREVVLSGGSTAFLQLKNSDGTSIVLTVQRELSHFRV